MCTRTFKWDLNLPRIGLSLGSSLPFLGAILLNSDLYQRSRSLADQAFCVTQLLLLACNSLEEDFLWGSEYECQMDELMDGRFAKAVAAEWQLGGGG